MLRRITFVTALAAALVGSAAFAPFAKAEIFQEQNRVDRERIVELDSIDILSAELGHLIGGLAGGIATISKHVVI